MSIYCFLASDKKLPPLSIGIDDQGYRIIIEDERRILNIFEDSGNCCTKPFTDRPVIMGVETGIDFTTVEEEMLLYLQKAMIDNFGIEIWWTWMGETDRVERRSVSVKELTVGDLRWILGEKVYTHPKCLKVYKWKKGKKGSQRRSVR